MKRVKVCLACNGGGHFAQLQLATKELSSDCYDFYWILDKGKHLKNTMRGKRYYQFPNPTTNKLLWVWNSLFSIFYLLKERPKVIISTGAGVAFPTMFFGKYLFGSRLIFVCSAANVTKPSRVPFQAYKICDEFYVQWPELLNQFPNAKYIGVL